ncbi:MAG: aromatic aminobenezylarsenical efflux permease ArsG family transporter [Candidatus Marinimicrobia bacterium]|nr:aromatic aminobenezylarsenical efflux permease ArsG family transporter [Candidatus Neomarinimicrobiota bacterium]
MNFLTGLFETSQFPILSAFILGLMTAISPCPLATNITAIGYISKDYKNKKQVLIRGVIYIIGRAITYTSVGLLIFFGASQFTISDYIRQWGEKLLGPLLIIVGLFMIGIIKPNLKGIGILSKRVQQLNQNRYIDVLLMGIVFALVFCPYSGVLYFGMLMPLTITNASGLYLPIVFAIATGIPALIFTWIIAYSASNISRSFNRVKSFENVFRKIVALVFIAMGIYYIVISY